MSVLSRTHYYAQSQVVVQRQHQSITHPTNRPMILPPQYIGPSLSVEFQQGGRWQSYEFRGFRWDDALRQWRRYSGDRIYSGIIVITRSDNGVHNGYLLVELNSSHVVIQQVMLRPTSSTSRPNTWEVIINWQGRLSHAQFGAELYRTTLAANLQFTQTLTVLVAVGTGIAFGAAFGPCAAGLGLAGGLEGATNVIASGLASTLNTFIQGNFTAMTAAVNSPGGVGRYWQNNRTRFAEILTNSIISGAFSAAGTYFLPAPESLLSARDWAQLAINRMGTIFSNTLQTLVSQVASNQPQRITEADVLRQLETDGIRTAIVGMFNSP